MVTALLSGLAAAVAPSYWWWLLARFLWGAASLGMKAVKVDIVLLSASYQRGITYPAFLTRL